MHEQGEAYLREQICQMNDKSKGDRWHLNSNMACILERREVLADLKRRRDERDAEIDKSRKQGPQPQRRGG